MDRRINIRFELIKVHMAAAQSGIRMELLDLIDYALNHDGYVDLNYLKAELATLRDLEVGEEEDWLNSIGENFKDNLARWEQIHNTNNDGEQD